MLSVYSRISSKRGADTFILFLMSASNTFIVFLRELASAREVDIGIYLENSPGSALSQMLDRELQTKKMRMAADDVLQSFVGRDILQCEPMRVFLTKILAGVVLELTVDKCSKPDWINSWVVYLLDEMTQPEALQKIDLGEATTQSDKSKRISRAEEEMTKALEEAETINKMIVDEDDRKRLSMDVSSFPKRLSVDASSIRSDDTDDHRYSGSGYASSSSSSVRRQEPALQTPPTPPQPPPPPPPKAEPFFASFDLIPTISRSPVLHRAHISLSDLTPPITANPYSLTPGEKALRSKPSSAEYLLQIEPASSTTPGWVVVRKHPDFEALHEVLKRIAAISGADTFRRHHAEMPTWRGETLGSLRLNLEGYLNDALHERGLAECEGMKRFLEKEPSTAPTTNRNSFAGIGKGWANPAAFAKMGQGALDALSKAPQGVAVGGKGLFGGMKKAFSVAGRGSDDSPTSTHSRRQTMDPFGELVLDLQARTRSASMIEDRTVKPQITCPTLVLEEQEVESPGGRPTPALEEKAEKLTDGRPASILKEQAVNHLAAIPLTRSESAQGHRPSVSLSVRHSVSASNFRESFTPASMAESNDNISLPPLPCDMPDDYDYQPSSVGASSVKEPAPTLPEPKPAQKPSKEPLTTQETQFIVEVVFAVLSELYTLSSAWTLRRSLLNVAKSILLRPGNASLENIRAVLQETVIDSYTTDEAVSGLVRKLTEAVFGNGEKAADAGEGLKERARELFMERGVPEALRGVMGAQASEEALGAVFDALQMETVARGVVGGVVLEGVRGVCQ